MSLGLLADVLHDEWLRKALPVGPTTQWWTVSCRQLRVDLLKITSAGGGVLYNATAVVIVRLTRLQLCVNVIGDPSRFLEDFWLA